MATIGKGLQAFIAGQSDLPETAAGHKQKPVEDFGWKPTDAQTQRDIARDKKYAPMQTQLFMEEYNKRQAPEPTRMPQVERKGPRMGIGLQRLLQDVKGAVKEPIEAVGATVRKGVNKVIQNQQETEKAMLSAGITPEKVTDIGMTVLQTTPAGAAAGVVSKVGKRVYDKLTDNPIFKGGEGRQLEIMGALEGRPTRQALQAKLEKEFGVSTRADLDKLQSQYDDMLEKNADYPWPPKEQVELGNKLDEIQNTLDEFHFGYEKLFSETGGKVPDLPKKSLVKKGIPEDWMGEKIASELGDVTITRSAKFPDKVQVTYWSGKAGTSPTVADEVFDSVEEAKAAVRK